MRIRIVQRPRPASIDGIRVDHFELGHEYDVGNRLAMVLLAEQWAVPVPVDEPENTTAGRAGAVARDTAADTPVVPRKRR
jgi:hypothetical protein